MLSKLSIRNIGLIHSAEIDFEHGLNILSGETGAGKSMIIDSMELALGVRADKDIIQSGASEAVVEAEFDVSGSPDVIESLKEEDIDCDGSLVLTRRVTDSGRNTCRVNGYLIPLNRLRVLTAKLIDILGQLEHYSLTDEHEHLKLLDGYAGERLSAEKCTCADLHARYAELNRKIKKLYGTEDERARRIDILKYQIKEIKDAKLKENEDEELREKITLLKHNAEIQEAMAKALEYLNGMEGQGALERVESAAEALVKVSQFSPDYEKQRSRLEQAGYELEDIISEITEVCANDDFNPAELEKAESRFDVLKRLMRKYGGDIEAVLNTRTQMENELEELESFDEAYDRLKCDAEAVKREFVAACTKLSAERKEAAQVFAQKISEQLSDLGMESAQFSVQFDERTEDDISKADESGWDSVRFLISPNPGQPLRPLAKIASGGEMSRIMLALKNIAADADGIPTLIFDEVDTGISGRMALVVAKKLAEISQSHQVICVTHTAQIAAMGDAHFYIEKNTVASQTRTSITILNGEHRIAEIERLVAGNMSSVGHEHALNILKFSDEYKKSVHEERRKV